MSWITDKLLGLRRIVSGVETLPERGTIEFAGEGVTVEDDTANKRTVVTIEASADGVVAATPDTIPQRGAAGELLATRIEFTGARVLAGDPTQVGDVGIDTITGQPYAYIDGVNAVPLLREKVRWPKLSTDSLDSDITSAFPIFDAPGYPWTITRVRFIPRAGLSANASNYAQLQVHIRDGDGVQVGSAAIGNTTPSGTDFTGSWTAFIPVALTLQTSLLAFPIDGGHSATFSIGKQGSGVIVPAGTLEMWVAPWKEP